MTTPRKVIVNIATSADGFIAGPGGDMEWLISRPKPDGFYGLSDFTNSIDTKLIGRKTYEESLRLGAKFNPRNRYVIFSRQAPAAPPPTGVEFASGGIRSYIKDLRTRPGKDIWLMGGGDLIASCLDEQVIDEFVVSVMPVFIGDGVPLIARRHRHTPLQLLSTQGYDDGVVQLRYRVDNPSH